MRMMSAIVKRQSVFICDLERGKGERGTELIVLSTLCVDGAPRRRKPFVEPDLFPDLESFLAAERAPLDQAVDAAVGVAVCVADVVESVGTFRTGEEKVEWELADVCSRWTSSSRSKFSVMVSRLGIVVIRHHQSQVVAMFVLLWRQTMMTLGQDYSTKLLCK